MALIGIIGGTGLSSLKNLEITHREMVHTPYGVPSAPIVYGTVGDYEVIFLARHGSAHTIPPHKVNYRANLWALKQAQVEQVIAVAAVGGIHKQMRPGRLAIPDQIVDYTWGRSHTYFEDDFSQVSHIDFTCPYCNDLRNKLIEAAGAVKLDTWDRGTYAATQGPRLETAAEIKRLKHDGCDMVGMTGMPEAALARELDLCYACCAVSANWAAGIHSHVISMDEIEQCLIKGMDQVRTLLERVLTIP